ncbi:MAG: lipopolysaccharide heptosyltransferase II [Candidatus Omnitrophica bacterium]|nr:lipopolysaccharide heptosyltransferase II [Candidatus Omnitrophota bacterium]MDD5573919.1 lipopolysaccharide heptosyltransferase II [Candidatus Omnitrophota bacterium]
MNILQILPQLNVGGVETGTVDLAKYLARQGHRSVVVSAGGTLVSELEKAGIPHYELPVDNKAFWVMCKAAGEVARIIAKEKIQIVHARSRVPAWVGFMACRKADAVFLTTAHGHYSRHIFSHMMGWGKYTIVPSSVIGKHMMEDFGVPLANIRLVPRSVDLERFVFRGPRKKGDKEFRIGVIGRITPIKGQVYFLKALARVLREAPYVTGWVVGGISPGKDNYMEELEVWTRRLGLSGTVSFLGNRRDIPEVLEGLDALVMPSIAEESFGRVVVEAQAVGVPVIASRVGGVVEIIEDGRDGLLVFPKDDEAIAQAVVRLVRDPGLSGRLAEAGRRKVEEKYSLDKMAGDTLAVYQEALESRRILVIKFSAVGDAILAIPSLKALKKKYPRASLVCLTGREAAEVFQRCPYIDELLVCDFKGKDKGWRGLWRLARRLLSRRFDGVVDLQNNKKSHLLSYATLSVHRYGYDNGKFGFLLNHRIRGAKDPLPPVEHQFRVLGMMGIAFEGEALDLWPSPDDEKFADDFLKDCSLTDKPWVGINIGSSPRWTSKRWIASRFSGLCDALEKKGWRVVLTGAATDAAFAKKILDAAHSRPVCAVAQTTLMQLAALIGRCQVYVTGDSAPMHVAAAMHVPFVALFGPTDPGRHLASGSRCVVLQKGCRPCYRDVCVKKTHPCMKGIRVEDVLGAVEQLAYSPDRISNP